MHYTAIVSGISGISTLTRVRLLALVLAGMLVLSAGVNNGLQFSKVSFLTVAARCVRAAVKCGVTAQSFPVHSCKASVELLLPVKVYVY